MIKLTIIVLSLLVQMRDYRDFGSADDWRQYRDQLPTCHVGADFREEIVIDDK